MKKILIVGGVAGGATAAARLRRLDETAKIILFERGEHISFANCGLPYYIGGVIAERESLLVQTVEGMSNRFHMDVRNLSEVLSIDKDKKLLQVKNLRDGSIYEESYDVLLLSPGANPLRPPIPGLEEADHVFTLRNIPDTDAIKHHTDTKNPQRAVVIGGGFIGVEMAENLAHRGISVTLVEMLDQVMAPFDFEMAEILHSHLREKGVRLILGDGVSRFEDKGKSLVLSSGTKLSSDLTILAIGVRPENELAKAAGLSLGERGHILVDENLQTSDPHIYAIGDAVETIDYIYGGKAAVPLASPANRQGRIAADRICGMDSKYRGVLGTAVAKVFDLTASSTGHNEKALRRMGRTDYKAIHLHPGSHAGYYPGAFPISLKLIFELPSGKILGAQAVGYEGVEKRIDVLSTAIKAKMNVRDLADLELAYAPPYSSAKDPVNMAGYIAGNILDGLVDTVSFNEIDKKIEEGCLLIDVREPLEREAGFIEGSVNIPLSQLRSRLDEIPKDKELVTTCQVGLRGYIAARILLQQGYSVKNLDGGYKTYAQVYGGNIGSGCCSYVDDKGEMHLSCDKDLPEQVSETIDRRVDARGLQCPGPIAQVFQAINEMQEGQLLEVLATDPGFGKDIAAWCEKTGHSLISSEFAKTHFRTLIRKGRDFFKQAPQVGANSEKTTSPAKNGASMVVFSGDLDKAMASLIIATGAASMGKEVTLFFTFWGLNILRKPGIKVEKDAISTMFGKMMPEGAKKLKLSNMNMGGMGSKMMNYIMKKKNVDSVETLLKNALSLGVKLVACSMSMDVMGITQEELIDGVEIAGVATYLSKTEDSNLNLFI
ncbi:MAG: FAD-dependent oxidoreductase [Peptostreptococcaceae bacterium]|nr:FAD-dependent oxidoreductase [Peptostreptococcaceae bacterium]